MLYFNFYCLSCELWLDSVVWLPVLIFVVIFAFTWLVSSLFYFSFFFSSFFLSHFSVLDVVLMFLLIALFVLSHFSILDVVLTFFLSYDLSGREMWQVTLCIRFSFAPCSDRIHVAVTDMAALFPNVSVLTGHVCDKCVCSLRMWTAFASIFHSIFLFFGLLLP